MPIVIDSVNKSYGEGEGTAHVLKDVSCTIEDSEICVIIGASGSGKSTLLNCLGGLDRPDSGTIKVNGQDIASLHPKDLTRFRRKQIGFVFQFYNLVQNLTALENVELASQICRDPLPAARVLEQVGLAGRADNFPSQLSGGEQQRVAIARALAKNPKLLLCDEPTGALDFRTGKQVLKLLQDSCRVDGRTVAIVTHNLAFTGIADRVIRVREGRAQSIETNECPVDALTVEW